MSDKKYTDVKLVLYSWQIGQLENCNQDKPLNLQIKQVNMTGIVSYMDNSDTL